LANDLSTLSSKLATQLRDTTHAVWPSTEKDDLVKWAVANLYPQFARPLDPSTTTITLVAQTYFYSLPAGVREVSSVDMYKGTIEEGNLDGQAWRLSGDIYGGTGKLRVSPMIVDNWPTYILRLVGYGVYDTSTNLIQDDLVPLVLALARAEAYRRTGADRMQFRQWANADPSRQVSMNELILGINEADNEISRLRATLGRTWRRPVAGRIG
jgi:hypothetical protein